MGRYPRGGLSGGCVRLRFFLLLVRACVLGCGRLRSSSLLPPPCSGLRARLWAAAFVFASPPPCSGLRARLWAASFGFGFLASLAVLACARFALSASSSVARLSCRHFYRHGGNAPWQPPDSRRPTADSRRPMAAARQPTHASLQPPDSRRPTADSCRPMAARHPTHASLQPTADARQLTAARR